MNVSHGKSMLLVTNVLILLEKARVRGHSLGIKLTDDNISHISCFLMSVVCSAASAIITRYYMEETNYKFIVGNGISTIGLCLSLRLWWKTPLITPETLGNRMAAYHVGTQSRHPCLLLVQCSLFTYVLGDEVAISLCLCCSCSRLSALMPSRVYLRSVLACGLLFFCCGMVFHTAQFLSLYSPKYRKKDKETH